jgi:hypothetical protein
MRTLFFAGILLLTGTLATVPDARAAHATRAPSVALMKDVPSEADSRPSPDKDAPPPKEAKPPSR